MCVRARAVLITTGACATGSAAGVESLEMVLAALEGVASSNSERHTSAGSISAAVAAAAAAAATSKRSTSSSSSSSSSSASSAEGEGGIGFAFKKLVNIRDDLGVTPLHIAVERYARIHTYMHSLFGGLACL